MEKKNANDRRNARLLKPNTKIETTGTHSTKRKEAKKWENEKKGSNLLAKLEKN
jgi:hypothetical protein